ncbi:MAG: restriction endonuclease subunit S [Cyclobacteriaceae bacterium]
MSKVPKLRFKEFNEKWGTNFIGDVFEITAGGDIDLNHVSQTKDEKFKYPIYANAEKDKGFYGYSDLFKIQAGAITVAGRGVNMGIAHARDHEFYPIVRLLVLLPKKETNILFFEYGINRLNLFVESTGVPQLTVPQISKYKIVFPSLPEQQKIASFLSAVDEKIQQFTRKKEWLEQYKKGVMQQLFSGKLRFKDPNGKPYPKWEEKKLGEVCEINPSTKEVPEAFIYIDLESVSKGQLVQENRITKDEAPSRAQRTLQPNDILYQTVRPYQMNNYLFDKKGDYVASTGYAQIRTNQETRYIYQLLHSEDFVNEVMERCTGTSFPAINSKDLGKIKVPVPHKEEQQKIARFLTALDAKIESVATQIAHTQTFKKGLLQQMFV